MKLRSRDKVLSNILSHVLSSLIIIILLSSLVYSLGITPIAASFEYERGATRSFKLNVISSGITEKTKYIITPDIVPLHGFKKTADEDKRLLIPNVKVSDPEVELTPGIRYPVTVEFTMPEFETPGLHGFFIRVTEDVPKSRATMGVSAKPSVLYKVSIYVPYPGKYADLEFNAPNTPLGEKVFITIKGWNRGYETLNKVSGEVKIYDEDGNLIDTVPTNELSSIAPGGTYFELWADWLPGEDISSGIYDAVATVVYDDITREVKGKIMLGDLDVEITDYTNTLTAGEINQFFVEVQSLWSNKINNVFVNYKLLSAADSVLAEATTPSVMLDDWDNKRVQSFLDLKNVKPGDYRAKITVYYDGNEKTKIVDVKVIEKKPEEKPTVEKPAIIEKEKKSKLPWIVAGLVVLLIIGQVLFFVIMKHSRDDDDDDDDYDDDDDSDDDF